MENNSSYPHNRETPGRSLSGLLNSLRKRLVDTGTRNRLVHVNRNAKRANVINIVHERSDDIYDIMRLRDRKMRFRAMGEDERDPEQHELLLLLDNKVDEKRRRDAYLETELGPQTLEKRLLKLKHDSDIAEEEQGANFLFLALGFLRWYEDSKSEVLRESPLVLLPVQLSRLQGGFTFSLNARPDDVTTNLPLQERLKGDFGILIPEIDDDEDWIPGDYFNQVMDVISEREHWDIDRDGMQLGFFSFAKALMYRDLIEDNWPGDGLTNNSLMQGLLDTDQEFDNSPLRFGPQDRLDEHLDPKDIVHVVEADSSQAKVIEEVRSGRNLVVQGPPGTGKSQTIANIIATAAHDGKTVLFVAEKMAALKVVHDRLVKVGLSDLCLELHSRTANKKAFYGELKNTLSAGRAVPDAANNPEELVAIRNKLNSIDNILHMKLEGKDYSPFEAIGELCRFLSENVPPPSLDLEELAELTNPDREAIRTAVRAYAKALEEVGILPEHPYFGVQNLDLQPTDLSRLRLELIKARDSVDDLVKSAVPIAHLLGMKAPVDLTTTEQLEQCVKKAGEAPEDVQENAGVFIECRDFQRLLFDLGLFKTWKNARNTAEEWFKDTAWNTPVEALRPHIVAGLGSGLRSIFERWFGKYRNTSIQFATLLKENLPRAPNERLALMDTLLDVQDKRRSLEAEENWLSTTLGSCWRGQHTDVEALIELGTWMLDLRSTLSQLGLPFESMTVIAVSKLKSNSEDLHNRLQEERVKVRKNLCDVEQRLRFGTQQAGGMPAPIEKLHVRLDLMQSQVSRYEEWRRLQELRRELVKCNLVTFVEKLESEGTSPSDAEQEFLYAVAEARWKHLRSVRPELDEVARMDRQKHVNAFQIQERFRMKEVRSIVRFQHLNQLPTGASGEMAFLRGECGKRSRHRPVRQAFLAAPTMIQRIKPVILMSPISIAQFLPPSKVSFDLLLIDEASQVRPEDALGAVARAKQIVVVGDDKQLPPTSFFDRFVDNTYEDDDEDAPTAAGAAEMESILKLAEARGLRQAMLEWHYRSRDPTLIKVSNIEFYESRLVLPPSPLERDEYFGMTLTRVAGAYSSRSRGEGRPGTNRVEAEHIADALIKHAGNSDTQDRSVGVVAFSKAQSDMITEVLEMRRRTNYSLDALLNEDKNENVFVKNIENVQGDERDVILVSVGYGPYEPNGRLSSMQFGPINNDGGERRLNVLFSRARMRCEIFVSFDWREIDLTRTQAHGSEVLRNFLSFAETRQILHRQDSNGLKPDSPLEEDVAQVIAQLGYPVDHQVGSAGFRIDLGVRHPDRPSQYILAVECDGATYHSALWARERDRLRQEVLEDQGWRFHRIWSTDWFYRREKEQERLRTVLGQARTVAEKGFSPPAANRNHRVPTNTGGTCSSDGVESGSGDVPQKPMSDPLEVSNELPSPTKAPAYNRATVEFVSSLAPHEESPLRMKDLVKRIIELEGPMHRSLVARRVANAYGLNRTGSRIVEATETGLRLAIVNRNIERSGDFYMTQAQRAKPPVRNRSNENAPVTTPAYLPPDEICTAAEWVESDNGVVHGQEQVRAIARLLGFQKVSTQLKTRIASVLKRCKKG